jgi:hypothetical protein
MLFNGLSQQCLTPFGHTEQIHHKNPLMLLDEPLHVLFETLMSHLKTTVDFGLRRKTELLKEKRKTTSHLQVTKTIFIYFDYLLSLTEICHIALIICPTIEISSSALHRRSPAHQEIFNFSSLVEQLETTDKTLNQRRLPVPRHSLLFELPKKHLIPNEMLRFFPFVLLRERKMQIVLVRKIKTLSEDNVVVSKGLIDLLSLRIFLEVLLLTKTQKSQR